MSKIRLTEWTGTGKVTCEQGVFRNAMVCGRVSKNGRVYTDAALNDLAKLIESKDSVYVDHQDGERTVRSRFGKVKNPRVVPEGLRGDLHYLESHPVAQSVKEDFERDLGCFGLSVDAWGTGTRTDNQGRRVVEQVTDLKSTDLVSEAATVRSLREQEDMTDDTPAEDPFKAAVMGLLDTEMTKDDFLTKVGELWDTLRSGDGASAESQETSEQPIAEQFRNIVKEEIALALREQVKPRKYVQPRAEQPVALREQKQTTEQLIGWLRTPTDLED